MAKRTGVPSLLKIAKTLCKFVALYGTLIKNLYPDNTALHLAIDTANTACAVLAEELEQVREYGD